MQRRALDPRQLALAQRLQRQGFLLREIARRIGLSFDAVCLGLYGDNQPSKGNDDGTDDAREPDGGDGAEPRDADDDDGFGAAVEARAQPSEAESVGLSVREAGGTPPAQEPVGASEPPGEPPAPVASPSQRFRLVSAHGESLHENGRVLTRLPKFFWRGDAEAVAALKARRPQWSQLRAVGVTDAAR